MKKSVKSLLSLGLATVVLFSACSDDNSESASNGNLNNEKDSVSYALGMWAGAIMKKSELPELNEELYLSAVRENLAGKETKMKQEQATAYLQTYFGKLEAKKGDVNLEEGKKFLAANKTKAGVITTPSGLQYEVITEGKGANPKAESTVTVNYKGTLIDGTVFDSSYERGQPATFPLNQVIRGWTEGIPLMKVGAKYKFYIPAELAYGPSAQGKIKSNSLLIFEVELLEIK